MKSYLIDEISFDDLDMIRSCLNEKATPSGVENLYWVELPDEELNNEQKDHTLCHPHRFAIELGEGWIKAEFFIRAAGKMNCECNGYCDDNQKKYIMSYVDTMISGLNIST